MTSIKREVTMLDSTAAGTSQWFHCDYRYDQAPFRNISVNMASGDTIEIQGTTYDPKGTDINSLTVPTTKIVSIKSYTASGQDIIQGPWAALRVVKTGTTGRAVVDGLI